MDFEWDEAKRQEVIAKRRVDILYAALIFERAVLTKPDQRRDYGADRWISLGMVGSECFVVVHTKRGDRHRLITAWKGGQNERRRYQKSIARRTSGDEGRE